jgi:hypothetical protein
MEVDVQHHTPTTLPLGKRPGCVGSRAGLDRCGKFHSHWDSIPRPPACQWVVIPTMLSWPIFSDYAAIHSHTIISHRWCSIMLVCAICSMNEPGFLMECVTLISIIWILLVVEFRAVFCLFQTVYMCTLFIL